MTNRKRKAVILRIILIPVLIYLGFGALLFIMQGKILFPAGRTLWRTPADLPYAWPYEDVRLSVNGQETHGWFIPTGNARGTVLFSHGNAGTIAARLESAEVFRDLGFNVLLYDYGGYGQSTGRPNETRFYADIRAMWRHLVETRGIPPAKIVLFGRSLGGGVSAMLASEVTPAALILESTFTSIPQAAQDRFPIYPAKYLVRARFDTASRLEAISCPVLVVHSPQDDIIPYAHGRRVFELANEPKQFLGITGGHNDGWVVSGRRYVNGIAGFLDSVPGLEVSSPRG